MTTSQRARSLLSRLSRSLPNRLLFVFLITSILSIAWLLHIVGQGFSDQWRHTLRPHLIQYLDYVSADLGVPPDPVRATELASRLPINIYIVGLDTNYSSNGKALDVEDLEFHNDHRRRSKFSHPRTFSDKRLQFGEHQDRTVLRQDLGDHQVYFELSHTEQRTHRHSVIGKILLGILGLLGLCYFIIRRMLRPVQDVKLGVTRMGTGELDHRVPVRADNDLGDLAISINTMAEDIEQMLDAKRQLLLGVSHELRSPLTRASLAVELLDESTHKVVLGEDLQEMEQLIGEILETERMNTPHSALNLAPLDLASMLTSLVADTSFAVKTELDAGIPPVSVDETRIKLVVRNLLNNAHKHGQNDSAPPILKLEHLRENQLIVISVTDFGPGIGEKHLDKVTEPFYRADPSRTRNTGGFGLGLYLCRRIVEAHRGELQIKSSLGSGTMVSVTIPA